MKELFQRLHVLLSKTAALSALLDDTHILLAIIQYLRIDK